MDLRDLIVLGADAFVRRAEEREHDARRRAVARTRLIDRLAAGAGVDAGAAAEARERGYSRPL